MADIEIKPGDAPSVEKLTEQVENLNKGIASYRDKVDVAEKEAKSAKAEAAAAKAEAEAAKKAVDDKSKDEKKEGTQLNPEDEKRLKAWAEQNGFVTKQQMEEEKARLFNDSLRNIESQAIDEFVRNHPEYEEEAKWEEVKKEFGQYKQPTSITGYRQLLTKIHKDLKGDSEAQAKARAAEENRKRLGLGGGSGGEYSKDTTVESLREKYPHLSSDQIITRLEEINKMAKDREERLKARKK